MQGKKKDKKKKSKKDKKSGKSKKEKKETKEQKEKRLQKEKKKADKEKEREQTKAKNEALAKGKKALDFLGKCCDLKLESYVQDNVDVVFPWWKNIKFKALLNIAKHTFFFD